MKDKTKHVELLSPTEDDEGEKIMEEEEETDKEEGMDLDELLRMERKREKDELMEAPQVSNTDY